MRTGPEPCPLVCYRIMSLVQTQCWDFMQPENRTGFSSQTFSLLCITDVLQQLRAADKVSVYLWGSLWRGLGFAAGSAPKNEKHQAVLLQDYKPGVEKVQGAGKKSNRGQTEVSGCTFFFRLHIRFHLTSVVCCIMPLLSPQLQNSFWKVQTFPTPDRLVGTVKPLLSVYLLRSYWFNW